MERVEYQLISESLQTLRLRSALTEDEVASLQCLLEHHDPLIRRLCEVPRLAAEDLQAELVRLVRSGDSALSVQEQAQDEYLFQRKKSFHAPAFKEMRLVALTSN